MNSEKLEQLHISRENKSRPSGRNRAIYLVVFVITAVAGLLAWPRKELEQRLRNGGKAVVAAQVTEALAVPRGAATNSGPEPVLTVSGYIVTRERIELSPRFLGVVKWIGVKKGDRVKKDQVVVRLDDAEYQARLLEAEGRLAQVKANVEKAQLTYDRITRLATDKIESKQLEDEARLDLESARATLKEAQGQLALIKTYIDWTVIRSPIEGVVLEKLVDPNELVVPQSFGGARGPSTALVALADPMDLQVEIELNESDLAKVYLNQKCRVSPEAFSDKSYPGYVAEIAPEANRQKGTLQIKVQIINPDQYLTPELSAKVEFLAAASNAK